MLSVKLLPSNSEILKLQYINEADLERLLVVCPSPAKADGVRQLINSEGRNIEVLTISKFISNCMDYIDEGPGVARKSELLLKLSTIWKIKNPDLDYDIFTKAFNLFTELRGFSLNLELLEQVFKEEDEKIVLGIKFFWLISQELGLVDEHESYHFLSEEIRTNESNTHDYLDNKLICFLGFKHLSGGQIDLLKSIGVRTEVIVPVHKRVYSSADSSTWLGWLDVKDEEKMKPLDKVEVQAYRFRKGRFSEQSYRVLNTLTDEGAELYLSSEQKDFSILQSIPVEGLYFKSSVDPFKPILMTLIEELKALSEFGKKSIGLEQVNEVINMIEEKSHKKDFYFRWLKVKSLFIKLREEWKSLSEVNQELTLFDIEVFNEILQLDLPRNFMIPLNKENPRQTVKSLDGAELNIAKKTVVIGGSFLGSLKGGESSFTEKQLENLLALGPIRSNQLDFEIRKTAIYDLAVETDLTLILEENIEETDISWLEAIESLQVNNQNLTCEEIRKVNFMKAEPVLEKPLRKTVSATSLQTFIDCPRKYYFNYINKIGVNPKIEESIQPFQLGIIEHIVIGEYFKDESFELKDVAVRELNKVLAKDGVTVSSVQYQEALYEIILLSQRGVNFVKAIRSFMGTGRLEFEKDFQNFCQPFTHQGSIDFFYSTGEGDVLIDFKRSQSGIPQVGEFREYKKIQAWYYLAHGLKESTAAKLFGYLNLKDPTKSLLYSPCSDFTKELKNHLTPIGVKVLHLKDFDSLWEGYLDFEKQALVNLENEKQYSPLPLNESVCTYCPAGYICDRRKL